MKYDFYPKIIVRTPTFPLKYLLQDKPADHLADPYFKEALLIAAPDLTKLIYADNLTSTPQLNLTITRYFNRMCFRCTPFGLFAGCSVASWGDESAITLPGDGMVRRSRPDKDFFSKLLAEISIQDKVFEQLSVTVNNTLYEIGKEYRIIERGDESGEFSIASLTRTDVLDYFIDLINNNKEAKVSALVEQALHKDFSRNETLKYLKVLMQNQVIFSTLDKAVVTNHLLQQAEDFFSAPVSLVKNKKWLFWKKIFQELNTVFHSLDRNIAQNDTSYQKLFELVSQSGLQQSANRLFQVDYTYNGINGSVSYKVKKSLLKGIDILKLISVVESDNQYINLFKSKFFNKYEYQEIPLLIALDPESGIDYLEGASSFDNSLTKELAAANSKEDQSAPELNHNLKLIIQKYEQAMAEGKEIIELEDKDLAQMESKEINLAATASVFFKLYDNDHVQIDQVGGSSGINLFTRFTDFNNDLYQIAKEITAIEQEHAGEVLLAEVIHEPELRSANVNVFPSLRQYDIPYFSQSPASTENQILLSDLMLSIRENKFVLRSVRLNKTVIPKISSAYNYLRGSHIFRFLGDLQNQQTDNLQFDFQKILPGKSFYPRVSYKNIVFAPALWKTELKDLQAYSPQLKVKEVQAYLKEKLLPPYFTISEGDNELLIDRDQEHLLNLFIDLLKKRKSLLIREFLFNSKSHAVTSSGGDYLNNQMIAILINKDAPVPLNTAKNISGAKNVNLQRKFTLGSEWVYYKLYGGIVNNEKLLSGHIIFLIKELRKAGLIKKSFFIRYQDPDPHIRLRFQLKDASLLHNLITIVRQWLLELEESEQIWKTQIDTYYRELERYGIAMLESEQVFDLDSMAILKILNLFSFQEDEDSRLAAGIRMTNDLINSIDYTLEKKIAFAKKMREVLRADCKMNAEDDKKINSFYRNNSGTYLHFLDSSPAMYEKIFKQRFVSISAIFQKVQTKCKDAGIPDFIDDLLCSHIHMSINRLFAGNQKVYEYIIYDYLFKYLTKEKKHHN